MGSEDSGRASPQYESSCGSAGVASCYVRWTTCDTLGTLRRPLCRWAPPQRSPACPEKTKHLRSMACPYPGCLSTVEAFLYLKNWIGFYSIGLHTLKFHFCICCGRVLRPRSNPWMLLMCSRKWSLRLVLCLQKGHKWGFSPVCVLRWWLRCWRRFLPWKTLQHTGHIRGGRMVWKENTATPQDINFLFKYLWIKQGLPEWLLYHIPGSYTWAAFHLYVTMWSWRILVLADQIPTDIPGKVF